MATKKQSGLTQEQTIRRQRLVEALEKVSNELRPLLYDDTLTPEKKQEVAFFLRTCDMTRLDFAMDEGLCDIAHMSKFVENHALRRHIFRSRVKSGSRFLAASESQLREICREANSDIPEHLLLLHRAYREKTMGNASPQSWLSAIVRG